MGKTGYLIVGGALNGTRQIMRMVQFTREAETYLGIEFKDEDGKIVFFYMAAGMTPAAAIEDYKRLCGRP